MLHISKVIRNVIWLLMYASGGKGASSAAHHVRVGHVAQSGMRAYCTV
jgi:hypothetical protein